MVKEGDGTKKIPGGEADPLPLISRAYALFVGGSAKILFAQGTLVTPLIAVD